MLARSYHILCVSVLGSALLTACGTGGGGEADAEQVTAAPKPATSAPPTGSTTPSTPTAAKVCRTLAKDYSTLKQSLTDLVDLESSRVLCDYAADTRTFTCDSKTTTAQLETTVKLSYTYETTSLFLSDYNFFKPYRVEKIATGNRELILNVLDFDDAKLLSFKRFALADDGTAQSPSPLGVGTVKERSTDYLPILVEEIVDTCTTQTSYEYNSLKRISQVVRAVGVKKASGVGCYTKTQTTEEYRYNAQSLPERALITIVTYQEDGSEATRKINRINYTYTKIEDFCI